MEKKGQIVGGELTDILIREKNGAGLELGDLLVVGSEKDYTILQVKNTEYSSQASPSTHELLAGMELEGYGTDLEFMEPELKNYIILRAKPLLHVKKSEEKEYSIKSPKRLPGFFTPIRSIKEEDIEFLKPEKYENSLYLGKVRSGSKILNADVYINAKDALTHHILIPATTGRGKSNLVKVMLCSLLESNDTGILVLDPHDEYYGRNEIGLKDHRSSANNLEYYSTNPPIGQPTLVINTKSIKPKHVKGMINLTQAQNEAIQLLYNKHGDNWIFEMFQSTNVEGVGQKTLKVLKRKFDNVLGIYIKEEENGRVNLGYRSPLFKGGIAGENTINDITESLENGKIVIIDSSKLSDYEELLVGSIILEKLFFKYKQYKTDVLKTKPVISVIIEEAPRVLGNEAIETRGRNDIYGTIAREGRKFQIGLIAITQLSSLIPKTILANMNTKIILGNEMATERHAIIDSASQDLSDDNRIIASLDKGEAIVSSIFTKFAIPIRIPDFREYIENYRKKDDSIENTTTQIIG